jgi:large subunit ribosomal protein L6
MKGPVARSVFWIPTFWVGFYSLVIPFLVSVKQFRIGNSCGFYEKLTIVGVGFRVWKRGRTTLIFSLGYGVYKLLKVPGKISFFCKKASIILFSNDFLCLRSFSSFLISMKFPDPYHGKGIRYANEKISIKQFKRDKR